MVKITISGFAFHPASITIQPGTTVEVTNNDPVTHTWTSETPGVFSFRLNPGKHADFTFRRAGLFKYHCLIHVFMTGVVKVT
jgi:plastocyanin